MSTKIYNGHEIVGHTLDSFLPLLRTLRSEIAEMHQTQLAKVLADLIVSSHDAACLGLRQPPKDLRLDAEQFVLARMKQSDFAFSVTVIPVDGRLLAMTFCDQKVFNAHWDAQPWRRDFAYWDNTDEPEDISFDEWEARGALWDKALGDSGVPGEAGYSYDITDPRPTMPYVSDAEILAQVMTPAERAQRQLMDYLVSQRNSRGEAAPQGYREIMALRESKEAELVLRDLTALFERHPFTADLL
jgi:hypothetical protein